MLGWILFSKPVLIVKIYSAILPLVTCKTKIDIMTVHQWLDKLLFDLLARKMIFRHIFLSEFDYKW